MRRTLAVLLAFAAPCLAEWRSGVVAPGTYFADDSYLIPEAFRCCVLSYFPLTYRTGFTASAARGASVIWTYSRASVGTHWDPATNLMIRDVSGQPRFEKQGYLSEGARTNLCLQSDDFTQAAWIVSLGTDAFTATGPDGVANTASTLTASTGANATWLQTIVDVSTAFRLSSCWIRRRTGTGSVQITSDNGTNWDNLTPPAGGAWVQLAGTARNAANPIVGIRIVTQNDAVDVCLFQHEVASFVSSAIPTTSASVARAVDSLTFPPAGNLATKSDGTISLVCDPYGTPNANISPLSTRSSGLASGVLFYIDTNRAPRGVVSEPGTSQADMTLRSTTMLAQTPVHVAMAYRTNDFEFCEHPAGLTVSAVDTAGVVPQAASTITVGADGNASSRLSGHVTHVLILGCRVGLWGMGLLK